MVIEERDLTPAKEFIESYSYMNESIIYGFGTVDVTLEQVKQYHYRLVQAKGGKECSCEVCKPTKKMDGEIKKKN